MLSKLNRVAMLAISFHKICMLLLARQYRYAWQSDARLWDCLCNLTV